MKRTKKILEVKKQRQTTAALDESKDSTLMATWTTHELNGSNTVLTKNDNWSKQKSKTFVVLFVIFAIFVWPMPIGHPQKAP